MYVIVWSMFLYTYIHFIETRLQITIGLIIKIQMACMVNRFASNLLKLYQAHRVAWLIEQEKNLK